MLARQDVTVVNDTPNSQPSKNDHARSFDAAAHVYEESRPGYPADAVDWLVPADARRVLDVGAGTGKFTRMLQGEDREVIAVDPSPQMLEVLRDKVQGVETLLGTAERLPLPDESVDAVTFAQAWHWVEPGRGEREVARVLKPGGTLGLIWNSRDDRVDWVRELGEAMGSNDGYSPSALAEHPVGAPFEGGESAEFGWVQRLSRPGILTLVRSRSYFLVKNADGQAETLRRVEAVLDRHPEIAAAGVIELPYVTQAYRFRRG
ncbi:class I SAM-dependent methyltransferase [Gryllotalpicola protaetiae]|uniref:Class I SAM-dependent methyltransferase n=1 Tax=Gryllotalpicola protaetiae TaxID=2419771 RepID=A0A387BF91_9MICO|nr:class I SAM-dependent methyltransferase [Gryllotalpicola protaetiae]